MTAKKLGRSDTWALQKADAFGARCFAHRATVALGPAEGLKRADEIKVGSGVLVSFKGRTFIATAAHNLDLMPPEEMTVVFPPDAFETAKDLNELIKKLGRTDWKALATRAVPVNPRSHMEGSELEDIAALEIDRALVPDTCWVYDLGSPTGRQAIPKPGVKLLVSGLPSLASIVIDEKPAKEGQPPVKGLNRVALEMLHKTIKVEDYRDWRNDAGKPSFRPADHFAVEFDIDKVPSKIHPQGLSGCGLWRPTSETKVGTIHVPIPVLVGIENNYHAGRKALKITRLDRLIDLLSRPPKASPSR